MPHLRIETSISVDPELVEPLLAEAGKLAAEALGKSIDYVQVIFEDGKKMHFGGNSEPTAFVSLISLGVDAEQSTALSILFCEWLHDKLDINPTRVFLVFHEHPRSHFGWNKKTFA